MECRKAGIWKNNTEEYLKHRIWDKIVGVKAYWI
jgi:hypothetical protein